MSRKKTVTSLLFVAAVAVTAGLVACNSSGPPPPPPAHLDDLRDKILGQIENPQLESDMLAEVDRMQAALEEMVEVISRNQEALFALRAEMSRDEWIAVFGDGS